MEKQSVSVQAREFMETEMNPSVSAPAMRKHSNCTRNFDTSSEQRRMGGKGIPVAEDNFKERQYAYQPAIHKDYSRRETLPTKTGVFELHDIRKTVD